MRPLSLAPVAPASARVTVVKVGGRAQGDPALAAALAARWRDAPEALCVVHGGGDEVSSLQRRLGTEPVFRNGRRVTTTADIDVLRMVLSGAANKRLVASLVACGVSAVGLSGEDAALIAARLTSDSALGAVGEPECINVALLRHLLAGDYLPVVSPVARQATVPGGRAGDAAALNVNGDDAAAAIAAALGAPELLFVADVPGVSVNGAPAALLDAAEAGLLVERGTASGGMAAKLDAAVHALRHGVGRVRIGDIAAIADPSRGTEITLEGSLV
ncbi:MAG: acetylglutamate kinase [Gemmatimonadota bacterium]|nr:acetylglutamate kinase [Gemmatimonadota bacterium]